jgi:hypothetical protein
MITCLSNDLLIQLIDWNNNTIGLNRILAVILIAPAASPPEISAKRIPKAHKY